jgi:sugar (pentulose or hexulose) kinase
MSSSDEQSIIVAIDVGSSSVRCSAYHDNDNKELSVIDSTSKEMRTVHPNTGKIQLSVVETVDQCIDELLQKLDHDQDRYTVSAVGFSTFVMNLVGVDASGELIGEEATVSYACNTPSVAKEVEKIKRYVGLCERKFAWSTISHHSPSSFLQ